MSQPRGKFLCRCRLRCFPDPGPGTTNVPKLYAVHSHSRLIPLIPHHLYVLFNLFNVDVHSSIFSYPILHCAMIKKQLSPITTVNQNKSLNNEITQSSQNVSSGQYCNSSFRSNFRMIQAVIKCFEKDQQSRELRRFRTCPAVYLYDVNTAIAK